VFFSIEIQGGFFIVGTTTFKKAEFVFGTQRGVCVSFAY
jgi:hypothetical protein